MTKDFPAIATTQLDQVSGGAATQRAGLLGLLAAAKRFVNNNGGGFTKARKFGGTIKVFSEADGHWVGYHNSH